MIKTCNRIIEYSFYGLFLLVPLAFTSKTSELFELNKMWLTWGLTIIIGASWFAKMILQKRFFIQRTPLDIPIGLFLLSQIISTIFSLDVHVSIWGYYSRFNGGLLSIISYILLYYAFVTYVSEGVAKEEGLPTARTDAKKEHWREGLLLTGPRFVKRLLFLSLISGLIVALWGLPSHFGYDPTCLIFRGTFDVSCWTADFMPKIRIFSTLGQPDWLAAYLAILIPIGIAFAIKNSKSEAPNPKQYQNSNDKNSKRFEHSNLENSNLFRVSNFGFWIFLLLSALFYIDLLFTRARSGVLGIWISLIFFFAAYLWTERKNLKFSILNSQFSILVGIFLIITFIIGTPINQLHRFTLEGIGNYFQNHQPSKNPQAGGDKKAISQTPRPAQSFESGGTESGDIRINVWQGAINAWKSNPLFGTGVETFAFAYYKYKPITHNLTSEWNFLYNKAHNEYLNYLATTGLFGLGTYLGMIGTFIFLFFKNLNPKSEIRNPKQYQMTKIQNAKSFQHLDFENSNLFRVSIFDIRILRFALLAGYISILVTNFFGFSVVIVNIYLFMIPAFVFVLGRMLPRDESRIKNHESRNLYQWTSIFCIILASLFMILTLFRFWQADIAYALGYNLDRAGEYQEAYKNLHKAVELRRDEPVFKDELSINSAIIATALIAQKPASPQGTVSVASSLTQEAINTSNEIISQYQNNVIFWKTRVRLFYTLSQVDPKYLPRALDAIEKASVIAPQDANILYNLGVLYGQNNKITKGIEALEKTIKLKPDYRDAHYALGLFYHTASMQKKAIGEMQYILNHLTPQDAGAMDSLKAWKQ